jgi:6-methylsalicylate decarboxylase
MDKVSMTRRTDLHQHMWTAPLVEALSARREPPFARPASGRVVLYAEGEAPTTVKAGADALESRMSDLDHDGTHRAIVSLSCAIGVESLARLEAERVLAAYERGMLELPPCFEAWGAIPLEGAGADDVDRVLDAGFVGLSLPAGSLSSTRDVHALATVLGRLEQRGAPLFIHPGPGLRGRSRAERDPGEPTWWAAMTRYVFDMQSAWLAFLIEGRPAHPELPVVFAMLAGCAPLHRERLAGRGGPACMTADPLFFYDCSSYGTQALDAMVRCVGIEQIVYGSDRPVVQPAACHLGDAARHAIEVTNPARVLNGLGVAA